MTPIRLSLLFVLALGAWALPAQDDGGFTNAVPAEAAAQQAEDAPEADETEAPRPAEDEAAPERADPLGDGADDVFVPTEELQADEEVTFPVDI